MTLTTFLLRSLAIGVVIVFGVLCIICLVQVAMETPEILWIYAGVAAFSWACCYLASRD